MVFGIKRFEEESTRATSSTSPSAVVCAPCCEGLGDVTLDADSSQVGMDSSHWQCGSLSFLRHLLPGVPGFSNTVCQSRRRVKNLRKRCKYKSSAVAFVLLICLFETCLGIIEDVDFPSEGVQEYWTWLMKDIGLKPGAEVEIELTNQSKLENVYVLMLTHEQWDAWHQFNLFTLPEGELNTYLESTWRGTLESGALKASFTLPTTAGRGGTLKPARY